MYKIPHETFPQEPSVGKAFPSLRNWYFFVFLTIITHHSFLFNMAARTLNAKFEVQPKRILMAYITMNFSSSVLDSPFLFIFSLVLISVSYLHPNNFIMHVFAATNPPEETRPS